MAFSICLKRVVSPPRRFISFLLETVFPARGQHMYVSPLTYQAALLFPVHLSQALIEPTSMCLSCVRIYRCIIMMAFSVCLKRVVSPPRRFISFLLETVFPARGPHMHVSPSTYQAALLFPVHLSQALIEPTSMCLSCVRVPVHKCTGKFQRSLAIRRRSYRHNSCSRWTLLGLLALSQAEMTYAIPSTGYALVNQRSLDGARQVRNVQNAVNQLTTVPLAPHTSRTERNPI